MHEAARAEGFTFYQMVQLCKQHELFEEELPTSETARKANTRFSRLLKAYDGVEDFREFVEEEAVDFLPGDRLMLPDDLDDEVSIILVVEALISDMASPAVGSGSDVGGHDGVWEAAFDEFLGFELLVLVTGDGLALLDAVEEDDGFEAEVGPGDEEPGIALVQDTTAEFYSDAVRLDEVVVGEDMSSGAGPGRRGARKFFEGGGSRAAKSWRVEGGALVMGASRRNPRTGRGGDLGRHGDGGGRGLGDGG